MISNKPQEVRLADYQVPAYLVDAVQLHFELGESATLVKSNLQMRRNPACKQKGLVPLVLQGADLQLKRLAVDGSELSTEDYVVEGEQLSIAEVPGNFELECVTLIKPEQNTSLEGLYKSNGMFCTQCEAEGFRKITYYPDRPDVMSVFTVTVAADKARYPVLLSNGNDVEKGTIEGGRHWVRWHDPHPKPAYLFALVAGDLGHIEDRFITCSGREVTLQIYVERENLDKCDFAMDALKRSMRWDEEVYGREYDLDKFMIVAVSDFNAGAMENKGLNIFNAAYVLTKPETATDLAFQRVEGVIGHEYFHNWSGNRVTCRDWFQLSLKEGFTVFRDQEFSADMGSSTLKRIDDVTFLRTVQFAEDAGPMAHPVRPETYIEISNFYTPTVYEKGAEVVRMMHHLVGPEAFRTGTDLYFKRHDGQAVTTEDFVRAIEDASGADLKQFRRWYRQAGTPLLKVTGVYDAQEQTYVLKVKQMLAHHALDLGFEPLHIPVSVALLAADGRELQTACLEVTEAEQSFVFERVAEQPIPSLLRGFSAPVKLEFDYSSADLAFLMQYDTDGFNRWDAGQKLAIQVMQSLLPAAVRGEPLSLPQELVDALRRVLADQDLDKAMVARMFTMPSEAYLSELQDEIEPQAIHRVRQFVRTEIARQLKQELFDLYQANQSQAPYQPSAEQIAVRSLKNVCLQYLMLLPETQSLVACYQQFEQSGNMTDSLSALGCLVQSDFQEQREKALAHFYQSWRHDSLVLDQWFSVQASRCAEEAFAEVKALLEHEAFAITNPNKVRALVGVFANSNPRAFHRTDGAGYEFLADMVIRLNAINPSVAARLLIPLTRWRNFAEPYSHLMKQALARVAAAENLSSDVYEIAAKGLK